MATPRSLPPPRRTCEESLVLHERVSPPHLRRILPRPVLPPSATPTAQQLTGPRAALHTRLAKQALDDNDVPGIARAIKDVQTEIDRCHTGAENMHRCLMEAHDDDTQLSSANTRNGLLGVACVVVVLLLIYFF